MSSFCWKSRTSSPPPWEAQIPWWEAKDGLDTGTQNPEDNSKCPPVRTLGVLDDVLQQQRVLGQALHFRDDQVLELQASALRIAFRFLGRREEGISPKVGSGGATGVLG